MKSQKSPVESGRRDDLLIAEVYADPPFPPEPQRCRSDVLFLPDKEEERRRLSTSSLISNAHSHHKGQEKGKKGMRSDIPALVGMDHNASAPGTHLFSHARLSSSIQRDSSQHNVSDALNCENSKEEEGRLEKQDLDLEHELPQQQQLQRSISLISQRRSVVNHTHTNHRPHHQGHALSPRDLEDRLPLPSVADATSLESMGSSKIVIRPEALPSSSSFSASSSISCPPALPDLSSDRDERDNSRQRRGTKENHKTRKKSAVGESLNPRTHKEGKEGKNVNSTHNGNDPLLSHYPRHHPHEQQQRSRGNEGGTDDDLRRMSSDQLVLSASQLKNCSTSASFSSHEQQPSSAAPPPFHAIHSAQASASHRHTHHHPSPHLLVPMPRAASISLASTSSSTNTILRTSTSDAFQKDWNPCKIHNEEKGHDNTACDSNGFVATGPTPLSDQDGGENQERNWDQEEDPLSQATDATPPWNRFTKNIGSLNSASSIATPSCPNNSSIPPNHPTPFAPVIPPLPDEGWTNGHHVYHEHTHSSSSAYCHHTSMNPLRKTVDNSHKPSSSRKQMKISATESTGGNTKSSETPIASGSHSYFTSPTRHTVFSFGTCGGIAPRATNRSNAYRFPFGGNRAMVEEEPPQRSGNCGADTNGADHPSLLNQPNARSALPSPSSPIISSPSFLQSPVPAVSETTTSMNHPNPASSLANHKQVAPPSVHSVSASAVKHEHSPRSMEGDSPQSHLFPSKKENSSGPSPPPPQPPPSSSSDRGSHSPKPVLPPQYNASISTKTAYPQLRTANLGSSSASSSSALILSSSPSTKLPLSPTMGTTTSSDVSYDSPGVPGNTPAQAFRHPPFHRAPPTPLSPNANATLMIACPHSSAHPQNSSALPAVPFVSLVPTTPPTLPAFPHHEDQRSHTNYHTTPTVSSLGPKSHHHLSSNISNMDSAMLSVVCSSSLHSTVLQGSLRRVNPPFSVTTDPTTVIGMSSPQKLSSVRLPGSSHCTDMLSQNDSALISGSEKLVNDPQLERNVSESEKSGVHSLSSPFHHGALLSPNPPSATLNPGTGSKQRVNDVDGNSGNGCGTTNKNELTPSAPPHLWWTAALTSSDRYNMQSSISVPLAASHDDSLCTLNSGIPLTPTHGDHHCPVTTAVAKNLVVPPPPPPHPPPPPFVPPSSSAIMTESAETATNSSTEVGSSALGDGEWEDSLRSMSGLLLPVSHSVPVFCSSHASSVLNTNNHSGTSHLPSVTGGAGLPHARSMVTVLSGALHAKLETNNGPKSTIDGGASSLITPSSATTIPGPPLSFLSFTGVIPVALRENQCMDAGHEGQLFEMNPDAASSRENQPPLNRVNEEIEKEETDIVFLKDAARSHSMGTPPPPFISATRMKLVDGSDTVEDGGTVPRPPTDAAVTFSLSGTGSCLPLPPPRPGPPLTVRILEMAARDTLKKVKYGSIPCEAVEKEALTTLHQTDMSLRLDDLCPNGGRSSAEDGHSTPHRSATDNSGFNVDSKSTLFPPVFSTSSKGDEMSLHPDGRDVKNKDPDHAAVFRKKKKTPVVESVPFSSSSSSLFIPREEGPDQFNAPSAESHSHTIFGSRKSPLEMNADRQPSDEGKTGPSRPGQSKEPNNHQNTTKPSRVVGNVRREKKRSAVSIVSPTAHPRTLSRCEGLRTEENQEEIHEVAREEKNEPSLNNPNAVAKVTPRSLKEEEPIMSLIPSPSRKSTLMAEGCENGEIIHHGNGNIDGHRVNTQCEEDQVCSTGESKEERRSCRSDSGTLGVKSQPASERHPNQQRNETAEEAGLMVHHETSNTDVEEFPPSSTEQRTPSPKALRTPCIPSCPNVPCTARSTIRSHPDCKESTSCAVKPAGTVGQFEGGDPSLPPTIPSHMRADGSTRQSSPPSVVLFPILEDLAPLATPFTSSLVDAVSHSQQCAIPAPSSLALLPLHSVEVFESSGKATHTYTVEKQKDVAVAVAPSDSPSIEVSTVTVPTYHQHCHNTPQEQQHPTYAAGTRGSAQNNSSTHVRAFSDKKVEEQEMSMDLHLVTNALPSPLPSQRRGSYSDSQMMDSLHSPPDNSLLTVTAGGLSAIAFDFPEESGAPHPEEQTATDVSYPEKVHPNEPDAVLAHTVAPRPLPSGMDLQVLFDLCSTQGIASMERSCSGLVIFHRRRSEEEGGLVGHINLQNCLAVDGMGGTEAHLPSVTTPRLWCMDPMAASNRTHRASSFFGGSSVPSLMTSSSSAALLSWSRQEWGDSVEGVVAPTLSATCTHPPIPLPTSGAMACDEAASVRSPSLSCSHTLQDEEVSAGSKEDSTLSTVTNAECGNSVLAHKHRPYHRRRRQTIKPLPRELCKTPSTSANHDSLMKSRSSYSSSNSSVHGGGVVCRSKSSSRCSIRTQTRTSSTGTVSETLISKSSHGLCSSSLACPPRIERIQNCSTLPYGVLDTTLAEQDD